ncbi:unnamed protein product [Closterium sp. NIES-54]
MVHQVLQHFGFQFSSPQPTPLSTSHSLSTPPSDENVELSGSYPELVGCLMYLMTCIRPDLAYPLSLLARYVDPGRHQKVHWDAAKTVLRYLCSTSGMGLVLGGWGPVVLTGHADDSWELRWLTYLLIDLGEQPRSPPVLYVDNKAMIALCQEHRTKHIALRYFLARELQQRGQLRLAYVATRANTADIFNKALPPAATCRPDLSYSASHLATYLRRPEEEHMAEIDRALHYLRADEEEAADAAAGLTAPPQPPPRTTAAAAAVRRERRRRGDICGSCGTHHPHPLSLPMTSHSPPQQQVRLGERGGRLALQVQSPPHTLPSPPHPPPQLLHVQQGEGGEGGGGGRGLQGARSAQDSRARVARWAAGRAVAATARAVAAAARAEVAAARAGAATARAVAATARAVAAAARAVAAAAGAVAAAARAVAAAARAVAATARAVAAAARAVAAEARAVAAAAGAVVAAARAVAAAARAVAATARAIAAAARAIAAAAGAVAAAARAVAAAARAVAAAARAVAAAVRAGRTWLQGARGRAGKPGSRAHGARRTAGRAGRTGQQGSRALQGCRAHGKKESWPNYPASPSSATISRQFA